MNVPRIADTVSMDRHLAYDQRMGGLAAGRPEADRSRAIWERVL